MPTPLLIVDVQQGFVNEFTHHIPDRIARLVRRGGHDPILFTRFVNTPGSPYRRFLDWHACEKKPETDLVPELAKLAQRDNVFVKKGFAGAPEELTSHLRKNKIAEIAIVGVDTDMCVLKVAMDLFDLGIKPIILADCCASTAGLHAHLAGLAVLSKNVGPQQLRMTELGEGEMAAPPAD